MGRHSVFVRLGGCNLKCVWCDTVKVWRKGESYDPTVFAELVSEMFHRQFHDGAMLVITGGEPLIPAYHKPLISFITHLSNHLGFHPFIEVETNGTYEPPPDLDSLISSYACSPKLKNSGVPKEKRLTPSLNFFAHSRKSFFKFVVKSWSDVVEALTEIVNPLNIPPSKVWLMPCADNVQTLIKLAPQVAHWAQKLGWNYSERLHLRLNCLCFSP